MDVAHEVCRLVLNPLEHFLCNSCEPFATATAWCVVDLNQLVLFHSYFTLVNYRLLPLRNAAALELRISDVCTRSSQSLEEMSNARFPTISTELPRVPVRRAMLVCAFTVRASHTAQLLLCRLTGGHQRHQERKLRAENTACSSAVG
jgi:hypothetical protein